ncbi:hypothetical protein E4U42_007243 [Claviceps africana]|uniref:Uncharacterized protein n=1 Tax=Claviceps africana TaxID=83212 RepID=A0A8K0J3A7_9HYPO|nr:hypothetical protein E4U42_007243 [Claviceps africana]
MTDSAPSPKRRHILSSINPHQHQDQDDDVPRRRPEESRGEHDSAEKHNDGHASSRDGPREPKTWADATSEGGRQGEGSRTDPRRSRLRLKSEKSRRRRTSREAQREGRTHESHKEKSPDSHNGSERHHSRRNHHHHRRRHRHRARSPTPPNPYDPQPLDPEAAFRESLFDAMADDEGASYWESVYGQPIHVYASEKVGPTGELEQMTEEEYAAHVRQRMWEKTHAGLLEQRAKQDERRKQKQEEEQRARRLEREMAQSLRRGEERRQRRQWAAQWDEYSRAWTAP